MFLCVSGGTVAQLYWALSCTSHRTGQAAQSGVQLVGGSNAAPSVDSHRCTSPVLGEGGDLSGR